MSDGNVAAEQLRLFIERIERLEEEKKGVADDIGDVYQEAKSDGFDTKTMKQIIKLRAMTKEARDEADALLETYRIALGMAEGETPIERTIRLAEEQSRESSKRVDELAARVVAAGARVTVGQVLDTLSGAETSAEEYDRAVEIVRESGSASTSQLQRKMRIGFNHAARLIEQLEAGGIVSPPDSTGKRLVFEFDEVVETMDARNQKQFA